MAIVRCLRIFSKHVHALLPLLERLLPAIESARRRYDREAEAEAESQGLRSCG